MPDIIVNVHGREFITNALKEAATTMRYKLEETIADLYKKEQIMKPVEKRKLKYIAEGKILPIKIDKFSKFSDKDYSDAMAFRQSATISELCAISNPRYRERMQRAMAESDYREQMQRAMAESDYRERTERTYREQMQRTHPLTINGNYESIRNASQTGMSRT